MPDYIITLKIRCRKRTVLQDIERIFKTGRFQERLEFSLSEHINDCLRLAYVDISEVDVSAKFSRRVKKNKNTVAPAPILDKKTTSPQKQKRPHLQSR
jgi:hypothetical protein